MVAELSVADVAAFTCALVDQNGCKVPAATPEDATATLSAFVDQINDVLRMLGGCQQTPDDAIVLLRYEIPTYEVVSSSVVTTR